MPHLNQTITPFLLMSALKGSRSVIQSEISAQKSHVLPPNHGYSSLLHVSQHPAYSLCVMNIPKQHQRNFHILVHEEFYPAEVSEHSSEAPYEDYATMCFTCRIKKVHAAIQQLHRTPGNTQLMSVLVQQFCLQDLITDIVQIKINKMKKCT